MSAISNPVLTSERRRVRLPASLLGGPLMKRTLIILTLLLAGVAALAQSPAGQAGFIRPNDNLVLENIPPIPVSIAERAERYGEFRAASIYDWHPTRRGMVVGTVFAAVPQGHLVKTPDRARTQLTFFPY